MVDHCGMQVAKEKQEHVQHNYYGFLLELISLEDLQHQNICLDIVDTRQELFINPGLRFCMSNKNKHRYAFPI